MLAHLRLSGPQIQPTLAIRFSLFYCLNWSMICGPRMQRKPKKSQKSEELWVAPNHSLKGDRGERGWDHRIIPPDSGRILELADIALGLKKPERKKKARAAAGAAGAHHMGKPEPNSPQE